MKLFFDFFRKYLLSKRSGSVVRSMARLCWSATLIGVAALIIVLSIMNGFNINIEKKLLGMDPHLVIHGEEVWNDEFINDIENLYSTSIISIEKVTRQDAIVRTLDGQFSGAEVRGLQPEGIRSYIKNLESMNMSALSVGHIESLGPKEILMGIQLGRSLTLFEGDEVLLIPPETLLLPKGEMPRYERMRIKGFVTTDIETIDAKLVIFPQGDQLLRFQTKSSLRKSIDIRLHDPYMAADIKDYLLEKHVEKSMIIETWRDRNSAMFQALKLEKLAMSTFLCLAIFITSFSLVSVITMLLSQKKKEIGLLMALGMSAKKVTGLFLSLGLLLSGLGLLGGLLIGTAVAVYIELFPPAIMPDIYVDSVLPSRVDPLNILYIAVFIAVVAFLSAILPVLSYINKSPVENLRR